MLPVSDKLYHFLLGYAIERNVDIDLCMYEFLRFRLIKKFRRFLMGKVKGVVKKRPA